VSLTPGLHALAQALAVIDRTDPLLRVELPLVTVSEANRRDKWAAVERARAQRMVTLMAMRAAIFRDVYATAHPGLVVLMTRQAPRELDSDNLARALKAVRDGVAQALGVDDRDPRVVWVCDQRKGKAAVEIAVHTMEAQ